MKCFLCFAGTCGMPEYEPYASIRAAVDAFAYTARELDGFGQRIEASVHVASSIEEVHEYPDIVLSIGPRGGIRADRT